MFETLFGTEHCTIHIHLHLHLKDVILDYGSVYTFWCFSFERYNGVLGSYYTNNHNIESLFMNKFILQQNSMSLNLEDDLKILYNYAKTNISGPLTSNDSMNSISLQSTRKMALAPMSLLWECNFTLEDATLGALLPHIHGCKND